ncbi:MAG: hypothetical protein EOS81_10540 [Mesorhizobium sp.]|uniref:hypothetical protein n=1 Tax=unclassified Mesorhizobium TaxID=325217 RepID=UPI000F7578CA|nr:MULTISPECIES: hypothetical protein [unclassified Mesorhizobium]RVC65412.1 hypothetical protein EN759_22280 [Mesorhizobium sp. M00.F.Ca.ET.038.03.1.1]AZO38653.1 hypothetical protein EJ072_32510 [Mesorhizobium sp. M2A.F.Ca.ET.046.03.2.1]RWB37603.1 MAG: hypothetical protein EOQ44_32740 [Mesorhizobium sp.]RWE18771.1 MAG: hypothetical protein EOS76_14765 [Mesorhizobium sp.]RWE99907.1 MAG: hypothetical protein EOS81_10540 [Mesorhizobium sp.]
MMKPPIYEQYGQPDRLQEMQGISPEIGAKIAAIVTFGSAIEYHIERYIWHALKIPYKGVRPKTDLMKITDMIGMLERHAATLTPVNERRFLETWCKAARLAFEVRNDIVHGLPAKAGNTVIFNRNPQWHGELRRKDFSDFWAEDYALDRMRAFMAVIARIIIELQVGRFKLSEISSQDAAPKAIREVMETLEELADRFYNPTFEKY